MPAHKQKKNSYDSRLLSFLNSAFCLWFLSSVVLGAVSYFYTKWEKTRGEALVKAQAQEQVEVERIRTIRKLDSEIASRLNYSAVAMQVLSAAEGPDFDLNKPELVNDALRVLERPTEAAYPVNVFPEYSGRGFQSLLWELKTFGSARREEGY